MTELRSIVEDIAGTYLASGDRGAVARYIPELAKVDPARFGIAVITADGEEIVAGDADVPFSIQSVSKVFSLTLALDRELDSLWLRVGREPSGDPFNSIVQLERDKGVPRNPFINAGAIVVADVLLEGHTPESTIEQIVGFLREVSGDLNIDVDGAVARSEALSGWRNIALANFMRAYGNLHNEPKQTLEVYFNVCAIAMSCRQLARAGRYLAWDGLTRPDGRSITAGKTARRVNALMLTCGHYDGSGEFAFRVGIPGKSGVGGGILAVVPGKASIACWSPGLNKTGNSQLGTLALEELAARARWSVFSGRD
ncbi:MAG: glutaminase [Rhodospirillales bacterium]